MKAIYLYGLFFLIPPGVLAQDKQGTKPTSCKCDSVYTFAEKAPEFRGGELALSKLLTTDVAGIYGAWLYTLKDGAVYYTRMELELMICKDGHVEHVNINRPKELPDSCRRKIAAVMQRTRWTPGIQGNKPVCVKLQLPVQYELQDY